MTTSAGGLTPSRGYRIILTQYDGARPVASTDCTRCEYAETFTVEVDATSEVVGRAVLGAVTRWTSHACPGYVGFDIAYPQDNPAGLPERSRGHAESHQGDRG